MEKTQPGCRRCGHRYEEDLSIPFYARYQPLVIVGHCPQDGRFFKKPDEADLSRIELANAARELSPQFPVDDFLVTPGPKSRDLTARGITNYLDLLSSRQLCYLTTAIGTLSKLDPGVQLTMALLLSTSLEFNSMLCGYKGARVGDRPGAIRHAFSYHAYTFPYLALENNPIFPKPVSGTPASGTLHKLFHDRVRCARRWAALPRERRLDGRPRFRPMTGEIDQGQEVTDPLDLQTGSRRFLLSQSSAVKLELPDDFVDFVVTDPPYFDSVQYSDLARFFHVWLQQMLPDAADWRFDRQQSAVAPDLNGNGHYTRLLTRILTECKRVLRKQDGRLIFTYHHWNPKGWASLTEGLLHAGFELVNRYVVQSENPVSVHISGLKALTHDAIFILAPAGAVAVPDWPYLPTVDAGNSYQFCHDCATLLGHMLNEKPAVHTLEGRWQAALS